MTDRARLISIWEYITSDEATVEKVAILFNLAWKMLFWG